MRKNWLIVLGIIIILGVSFSYATETYVDVPESHWANKAIEKLNYYKIITGYPDGTFKPNNDITKAEFAKILVNVLDLDTVKAQDVNYSDVSKSHWAYSYIKVISPLLPNSDSSKFLPNESITREEVATVLIKALKWDNKEYDEKILEKFTDSDLISGDSNKYISIAVENELMNGNLDGTFNPGGSLTRAEVAQLVYNIYLKFNYLNYEQYNESKIASKNVEIPKDVMNNSNANYTDEYEYTEGGQTFVERVGKIKDQSYQIKYVRKYNFGKNVSLDLVFRNEQINDGGSCTLYRGEKIYAFINNASNKNNIYYMFSYGDVLQTTEMKKVSSSSAIIEIPSNINAKKLKLTIQGTTVSGNSIVETSTQAIYINFVDDYRVEYDAISENESIVDNDKSTVDRDLSFITIFNGTTLRENTTIENAKADQKLIVRGKPVGNIRGIRYRWDDGEIEFIKGATGTISIPKSFKRESSHKLKIVIEGKDGSISSAQEYVVNISPAY